MNRHQNIIRFGGIITSLFSVFHLMFYWMLDWENSLSCLNQDNWAIMMTFNVLGNMIFLLFSVLSFRFPEKLVDEFMGRIWLLFMASVYVMRIVAEFVFWTPQLIQTGLNLVLCGLPAVLYVIPVFNMNNKQ